MVTKSKLAVGAVLTAGLPLLLCGCGNDSDSAKTATHLGLAKGDTRLFAVREQTVERKIERATVANATRQLVLRADCLGGKPESTMHIEVSTSGADDSGFGGGQFACTRDTGGGLVILGNGVGNLVAGDYIFTISAPRGATWSAAVDAD